MPVESASDRAAFTSPAEFGDSATLLTTGGTIVPLVGIFDTFTSTERPTSNSNSSVSPVRAGASNLAVQNLQFTVTSPAGRLATADNALTILTGDGIGVYRIRSISLDGIVTRYALNRAPV